MASLARDRISSRETALALVRRYGWNSTAYQILNPGIALFASVQGDAVTGYVDYGGVRVAAGVPVCRPERLIEAMAEFEEAAAETGRRVCYFYAEDRAREMTANLGAYRAVQIGTQPIWHPHEWAATFDAHASLRAQLNRARNKGLRVVEWPRERAGENPALQQCLYEWLTDRRMSELHFLVEPETLGFLEGRRIFVAEKAGTPLGFLIASPIPLRRGWLIEQVIRGRAAPNGTAESLIDAAVRAFAADGDEMITLGLAALNQREIRVRNPGWLHLLFTWARAHGRRFYNFGGLDTFKAKFRPHHWEPVYMLSREERFSFGNLIAVAGAFTGGHLGAALLGTLARAARQEVRWLRRRLFS